MYTCVEGSTSCVLVIHPVTRSCGVYSCVVWQIFLKADISMFVSRCFDPGDTRIAKPIPEIFSQMRDFYKDRGNLCMCIV